MSRSRQTFRTGKRLVVATLAGLTCATVLATAPPTAAAATVPYRQDDYAAGQALSILPPGEHGR